MLGQLLQGFMGGGAEQEGGGAGQGMPADLAKMLGGAGGGSQDEEIGNLMKSIMGPQQTGQPNCGSLADMMSTN